VLYCYPPLFYHVPLTGPASDPALLDVARGVHAIVIEARDDHYEHSDIHVDIHHPHTVRARLGEAITGRLLLLCRAQNDEALPEIYHSWGGRCRGVSARWVIHQLVDAACAAQDVPAFEVTPTQVMAFQSFGFAGAAYFEVDTGLLPFSITTGDATSTIAGAMLEADRDRADTFDLGGDSENGAIAPGGVCILQNLSGILPQTWMEAQTQVWSYLGLPVALLGNMHPTVAA
jgi:hypothetical protein